MEFKELKKKTEPDLHKILAETRDKLRDLRFKDANKQLKDVHAIKRARIIVQQVLTLLNSKKSTDPSTGSTSLLQAGREQAEEKKEKI